MTGYSKSLSAFFMEFPDLFLRQVRAYVEPGSIEFLDKEMFIDVTVGERLEPDLVAKVKFKGRPAFFIIHIENQSQPQKEFGRRFFRYFSRLYDKYELPVYPIVVFSFNSPRVPQANCYRVEFPDKVVNEFRYEVIQLNRMNWSDFVKSENPIAAALMAKMHIAPNDRPRVKLECLRLLVTFKLDKAKTKLISGFVDTYIKLAGQEQERFEKQVKTLALEEKEEVMEIVTSWMEEGLKRGRRQGLQRGRKEGRQEGLREGLREGRQEGMEIARIKTSQDAVIEILRARFKRAPAQSRTFLRAIKDVKWLKQLLSRAATVSDLKEFERLLAEPPLGKSTEARKRK
jgi:predicted transposase YdaD